ncbi:MAG: DMT family transporter [Gammaproteobacteria bacterium]|nr:MAG: DMT family transporter [Gammaproteobacteria bacterium]
MRADNPAYGALLVSCAALMFASMGVLIRFASHQLPNESIVFFRNLFGLLVLLPLVWRRGVSHSLKTDHLLLHLVRSLFGLAAMYCFFYALAYLPLASAVLLNFTAPLFIPFIAMIWLKESVSSRVATAILIGFTGVLLVLKPGSGLYSQVALIGLASGAFAAVAMVSLRRLSRTEPPFRVVVIYGITCTTVSSIPLLWSWQTPGVQVLVQLAGAGTFATAGQYLLSKGYAYAPAAQIGPFTYIAVVFAAGYGWFFWQEISDWISVTGTLLIVIAGVLAMQKRKVAVVA